MFDTRIVITIEEQVGNTTKQLIKLKILNPVLCILSKFRKFKFADEPNLFQNIRILYDTRRYLFIDQNDPDDKKNF
jgi:hypothetical protein